MPEDLERLNAQIDVWIDEEDYDEVEKHLEVDPTLRKCLKACFKHASCTDANDSEWSRALGSSVTQLPINAVIWPTKITLDQNNTQWSRLLWAKLLRSKVMRHGTDCYFRRLDSIVAYLENSMPLPFAVSSVQAGHEGDKAGITSIKLAVIYLLELSAAAEGSEVLAFAQRAHRLLLRHFSKDDPFRLFYDLWAAYNTGVAYFHEARYRKAALEFNRIIREIQIWEQARIGSDTNMIVLFYYDERTGNKLLFLPAIIYRADIQLKLQLAYQSLRTINDLYNPVKRSAADYKNNRALLIEAEACQQMGWLGESWKYLGEAYSNLLQGELLGSMEDCIMPAVGKQHPVLTKRMIDLLIECHLSWLGLEGNHPEEPSLPLANLVHHIGQSVTREEYEQSIGPSIGPAIMYLSRLRDAFLRSYFPTVRHNSENRKGYYQQLAHYIAWLAKASNPQLKNAESSPNTEALVTLVKELYQAHKGGILEQQKRLGKGCHTCARKGMNLLRLLPEHYDEYTKDIFDFFDLIGKHAVRVNSRLSSHQEQFTKILIELERDSRDDLRIRDLQFRYRSREVLKKLSSIDHQERRDLCWKGSKDKQGFAGLLDCTKSPGGGGGDRQNDFLPADEHVAGINPQQGGGDRQNDFLPAEHYERMIGQWDKTFLRRLEARSVHQPEGKGLYFLGLQRWNSSSPAQGYSVGGGYLLYHTDVDGSVDMGIAIDPGFDFVRNLFHMGFSLSDIDVVLITHAHVDHIRDFESMITLLFELSKRGKQKRRVHVILTLGTYRRLEHIIEDSTFRYFIEPYIIDLDKEIYPDYFERLDELPGFCFEPVPGATLGSTDNIQRLRAVLPKAKENSPEPCPWIDIKPTRAYHDDESGYSDSFGFLVKIVLDGEPKNSVTFGYTGDTKWVYPQIPDVPIQGLPVRILKNVTDQYRKCDILLVHLGSLIDKNSSGDFSFGYYGDCLEPPYGENCEKLVRDKGHPYVVGMLRLLSGISGRQADKKIKPPPLVLLSEFGEELRGGMRVDLIRRLRATYEGRLAFLPVDVGITVQLWHKSEAIGSQQPRSGGKVWCLVCNDFVHPDTADFETYGEDEALFCVCRTCRKATPRNVLDDRLRHLYDIGIELRIAPKGR